MTEPKCIVDGESIYYPVWIEEDGTEWFHEPVWEGCEYGSEPYDPDHPERYREMAEPSGNECPNAVEYMGDRGRIHIQLCGHHFRNLHWSARVRWAKWEGDCGVE